MSMPSHPVAPEPTPASALPGETGPLAGPVATTPVEIVPRGILWSLAVIPVGMVVAVLLWKMGFIASISSFLVAGGAAYLYTKGAGTAPKRGLVPLIGVIVVGVVLSFFAIVVADLLEAYNTPDVQALGYPSALEFVRSNMFYGDYLASYGTDLVMFVVFALLGVFGTLRRLLQARPA
jgi:hypothetical protein